MKTMIFAAGLGTRLRPLTDTMPKALVPIGGRPLLEILLRKLGDSGFHDIVINIHHFADQIEEWVETFLSQNPEFTIALSDERKQLLETGGGIRHASPLFGDAKRLLIHNVDIISNCSLTQFIKEGSEHAATLLVSQRKTQRYLLFDENNRLVGWTNLATGQVRSPYPNLDPTRCRMLAFAGIHHMSTSLLPLMNEWPEKFSIIDFYLSICDRYPILGYEQPDLRLMDVGKIDSLAEAERFVTSI